MPKPITQPTTAQSLGALLKSARDIMRKDKGLYGDLGCLPMLTFRSSRREETHSEESDVRTPKSEGDQSLLTLAATDSRNAANGSRLRNAL